MTCLHVCVFSVDGGLYSAPWEHQELGNCPGEGAGSGWERTRRAGPGGTPRGAEVSVFVATCLQQMWVPRTSVSAPPPFLTRNMGSVLSCYTSSLLGGFWTGCHSSHAGSEGFPSLWPGRGAARGSPAASWLCFCWVWGKRGAVCNNTLSVGCPLTLSRTTLDRWGIRKSAAP